MATPATADFHLSTRSSNGFFSRERTCVAAICFRFRAGDVEFLLVRTKSGRWTFPKGGVDGDPTFADAAAREAYEEAGVRGHVEAAYFTRYLHAKRTTLGGVREQVIHAHLCEVRSLEPAPEEYRMPRWFSPQEAKERLARNRASKYATEVTNVVNLALIQLAEMQSKG